MERLRKGHGPHGVFFDGAFAYNGNMAAAVKDDDATVAERVRQWEIARGLEPRDWGWVTSQSCGGEALKSRLAATYISCRHGKACSEYQVGDTVRLAVEVVRTDEESDYGRCCGPSRHDAPGLSSHRSCREKNRSSVSAQASTTVRTIPKEKPAHCCAGEFSEPRDQRGALTMRPVSASRQHR